MNNFEFHAYTDICFGKGQILSLPDRLEKYGRNILLVYGGGSIKRNGIYDDVMNVLKEFNVTELSGVEPNPKISSVRDGVNLCRENNIDIVLAVGGGSTIDCAKAIAGSVYYDGDPWDIVTDRSKIKKVMPIAVVLTIAATGSEMNKNAVISDETQNIKLGTSSMDFIPQVSVLDPTYTFGVSKLQTASGTADIMSHVIENYFGKEPDTFLQDRICESILKTCIHYLPAALANPEDYSARSNLMWASTLALNGLCGSGKGHAWTCHPIEHELSAYYDITHGVGLAIVTPRWMRYILNEATVDKFVEFAENVWGLSGNTDSFEGKIKLAEESIKALEKFFTENGLPSTITEIGIGKEHIRDMAEAAIIHGAFNKTYINLNEDDIENILNACI